MLNVKRHLMTGEVKDNLIQVSWAWAYQNKPECLWKKSYACMNHSSRWLRVTKSASHISWPSAHSSTTWSSSNGCISMQRAAAASIQSQRTSSCIRLKQCHKLHRWRLISCFSWPERYIRLGELSVFIWVLWKSKLFWKMRRNIFLGIN